jgi:hypothetical protein
MAIKAENQTTDFLEHHEMTLAGLKLPKMAAMWLVTVSLRKGMRSYHHNMKNTTK